MKINLDNLESFITKETLRAIRETFDGGAAIATDERQRQEMMWSTIKKKKLHVDGNKDELKEEEDDDAPAEDEPEAQPTGVPDTIDKDAKTAPREDRTGGKGTEDSPKLANPTPKQLQTPTVGAVVDKLNALRGGRSLSDPQVKKSFSQYFENLTKQERESLLVFMTGLSQILAGVTTGAEALDPGDVGLRVKDVEGPAREKAVPTKETGTQEKSKRPGSVAQPIIVGEHQQKHHVRKILETYKRYK